MDSKEVNMVIIKENYHMVVGMSFPKQIHKELNKLVEFCIKHVYQEANKCWLFGKVKGES